MLDGMMQPEHRLALFGHLTNDDATKMRSLDRNMRERLADQDEVQRDLAGQ